jgi:hypothetical protein
MALSTIIETRINAAFTAVGDLGTPTYNQDQNSRFQWDTGVGANQADVIWSDERSVSTGATDSLDVAGVLSGLLGGTLSMARVKAVRVRNSNAAGTPNTTNISLTRPATNGVPIFAAAGDAIPIHPGGEVLIVAPSAGGYVVTAATADLIDIVNAAGATAVYRIEIIGGLT